MTPNSTKKSDDDLTLWIGGVMLVVILVLGVLWVQQGKELGRLTARCAALEVENKALREMTTLSGLVPGDAGDVQSDRPGPEQFEAGGGWRELDLVEDGIIIENAPDDPAGP